MIQLIKKIASKVATKFIHGLSFLRSKALRISWRLPLLFWKFCDWIKLEINGILRHFQKWPVPAWRTLRVLGQNKILNSSYFWFIFVPIAAKFILQIESPIHLPLFGKIHVISLDLPFSWIQFFFAAVSFTAANLLFVFRCPEIVKDYSTPHESYMAGNGYVFLCHQLKAIPFHVFNEDLCSNLFYSFKAAESKCTDGISQSQEWLDAHGIEDVPDNFSLHDLILANLCRVSRDEMRDLFSLIHQAHSVSRPISRLLTSLCYAVGFVLIGNVLLTNIRSVVDAMH